MSELNSKRLLVDVNPMVNTSVIELMLQLPGLDKDMIVNVSDFNKLYYIVLKNKIVSHIV